MKKILIVFGGKSAEHEVSIASAASIFKNIDKEKYIIGALGVTKKGAFVVNVDPTQLKPMEESVKSTSPMLGDSSNFYKSKNWLTLIEDADVIFPLIHGPGGEDGSLQGLFETLNKKYVGSKVTSSAVCMDKTITKILLEYNNIPVVPFSILTKKEYEKNQSDRIESFSKELPLFIKPANLGSSIGITKVKKREELAKAINLAFKFDNKILIEKAINGRELEISVLGNNNLKVSLPGEIVTKSEYYDYNTKYITDDAKLIVPAKIDNKIVQEIKDIAKKAYRTLDCKGLARIDFFLQGETLFVNEVNTIPGFTKISMYPMLFINEGITYTELISKLIELADDEE